MCKAIQGAHDSLGFSIPHRGLGIPGTGFQFLVSGTQIPDSLSKISDSKAQDSGFNKQNFSEVWIPQAKFSRSLWNFPDLGNLDYITIWITLGEAAI